MNFKIDDKNYDSEKLSDNGKLYLAKLKNITVKEQNLALEASDLNILRAKYTELLKAELPKEEVKAKDKKD
jgi:hypothetical protein